MFPVSRPASAEIDQNNAGPERRKGHSKFCRSQAESARQQGKILQPVVLVNLQRKGPVRQRSKCRLT